MTAMPTMRNIANDTPADATDVDWNFDTIATHIANEMINRDGSVAMTAALTLPGAPVAANEAATKGYVDALLPAGMIAPYAGAAAPSGWLMADGAVVSQATYAALYAVCGALYNTGGEGAGNFRLPNLKARFPVGKDSGVTPHDTLGETGGSRDAVTVSHSHTVNSHTHTTPSHQHTGTTDNPGVSLVHSHSWSGSTGNAGTHAHDSNTAMLLAGAAGNPDYSFGSSGSTMSAAAPGSSFQSGSAGDHSHTVSGSNTNTDLTHTHTFTTASGGSGTSGGTAPGTDTQGVSGTNANLPPYLTVNYIIKT